MFGVQDSGFRFKGLRLRVGFQWFIGTRINWGRPTYDSTYQLVTHPTGPCASYSYVLQNTRLHNLILRSFGPLKPLKLEQGLQIP